MTHSAPEKSQVDLSDVELDALQFGVDIALIEFNLRLSYEERIHQHQAALALVQELVSAREALDQRP